MRKISKYNKIQKALDKFILLLYHKNAKNNGEIKMLAAMQCYGCIMHK